MGGPSALIVALVPSSARVSPKPTGMLGSPLPVCALMEGPSHCPGVAVWEKADRDSGRQFPFLHGKKPGGWGDGTVRYVACASAHFLPALAVPGISFIRTSLNSS